MEPRRIEGDGYVMATCGFTRLRSFTELIAELGFAVYLELEIVVFFVCSDPEPVVMTIPLPSQGTVATAPTSTV